MFDKLKFANILKKINEAYENQTSFANASNVNRTYLSQYINIKLDNPPSPKVLRGIAKASKGLTTYEELMALCGYITIDTTLRKITNSLTDSSSDSFYTVPLFISEDNKLYKTKQDVMLPIKWDGCHSYFAYITSDDAMAPLLNIDDIAIIEQQETNNFENGKTYLLEIDNKILIRKMIENSQENQIEFIAMNPYYPPIKTTKDKVKIIGKVIRAENQSAFK